MIPSAELNCRAAGRPGRPRARLRDRGQAGRVRGRAPRPRRDGGVDHRAGRRRLPRPSVLDRRNPGHARAARHRLGHRGLQRRLRARARPRALHRPLGRAARRGQVVLRDRERRQPPPGLRLRPRLDLGQVRADRHGRARRAPHRLLLQHVGAAHHVRRRGWRLRRGAVRSVQLGQGRLRRLEWGGRQRGPARIPLRRRDPRHRRPTGSITAARLDLPESAPYARVEVADVRGGRAWTNPL